MSELYLTVTVTLSYVADQTAVRLMDEGHESHGQHHAPTDNAPHLHLDLSTISLFSYILLMLITKYQ